MHDSGDSFATESEHFCMEESMQKVCVLPAGTEPLIGIDSSLSDGGHDDIEMSVVV